MDTHSAALPLGDWANIAEGLARDAGAHALAYFRQPVDIETKADLSPVTVADREVEQLLRTAIAARFPDHAILGEEFGAEGASDAPLWIVDPIDGTRSFITGWPIWGTLLALFADGRARIGVIEMPALGERWLGIAGQGAWFADARNGQHQARASGCRDLAQARFYTTSPRYFDADAQARIAALIERVGTARFGGDCYSYGLLASGHVDLVVEAQLQPYDFLPVVPVIEGAGGVVTDWAGAPLTLASDGRVIAAATTELHATALAMLRG
ncbi:histidinol-phosphatase [Pararhodobacter sp. SW119]|uniref:histidinol-phosphatase n=1 Tax=Pararhodobacter sp. SW119 TaxID=2780075 RepID=UPI001AE0854F|nr:histidinol-phosphatase [Pararhodobacter sp. SW119]